MELLDYIKNRWYIFAIIVFAIGAGVFIANEQKKQEKYDNCNCGEGLYSKSDYKLYLDDDYVVFKCTFCKKERTHTLTKNRVYQHPTCTVAGFEKYTYTCSDVSWFSHEVNNDLGLAEHQFVLHNPGVKPTCTEGGISDFEYCKVCNLTRGGEEIGPAGHSLWTIPEVKATCTESGHTAVVLCENCDHYEDIGEVIPALGHDYVESIYEATYNTDGYKEYVCSRCDDSYRGDIILCGFSEYCNYSIKSSNEVVLNSVYSSTVELIIPETINGYPVVAIADYFTYNYSEDFTTYKNTTLKKVVMPNTITTLGTAVFHNCVALEEVVLSDNITAIPQQAFESCIIKKINLPSKLETIGHSAFLKCELLEEIIFPETLTSIGTIAFNRCYNLKKIVLPTNLDQISTSAFEECTNLSEITLNKNLRYIASEAFLDCINLKTVYNLSSLEIIQGKTDHGYVGFYAENIYTSEN